MSPDPQKVTAIKNAPPPCSIKDVRTFLGMVTYCSKFIQNFSDLTQPLRDLTKKNTQFTWTTKHNLTFTRVKDALTSDIVMAYFDNQKTMELVTDASPWGLSSILSQCTPDKDDSRIVAYVSRCLSPVEKRYSQTEREALAIVWAIERLHIYLFGAKFNLYMDCKPMEMILGNRTSKTSARIECWNLRIQDYDFNVIFTKGKDNPSDFLSRHPDTQDNSVDNCSEAYIHFLSNHAVPKAMTLDESKTATKQDLTIQKLCEVIRNDTWKSLELTNLQANDVPNEQQSDFRAFHSIRAELAVNDSSDIILRGSWIVIPKCLQQRAVDLAHEGHQGLVKTKQLLREKVWFPNIDKIAKMMIEKCLPCQANSKANTPEPLQMSKLPTRPWDVVHIDFCGPFPTGELILVVIDAYSQFPDVEIIHSTSARATIPKVDRIFAT